MMATKPAQTQVCPETNREKIARIIIEGSYADPHLVKADHLATADMILMAFPNHNESADIIDIDIGHHARWMPIQASGAMDLRERRKERVCIVRRIPWELIDGEPCERQSQKNHDQSVSRIAERGGYSACEALCVIAGVEWQAMNEIFAHRLLYAMHVAFNRGRRRDVNMLRALAGEE